jgi:predicted DsbA family dithiol-disulfide isomerase
VEHELRGQARFVRRAYLLVPREGQRPAYDEYVIAHRVRAAQMLPELKFAIPQRGQKYPSSSWNAQVLALRVQEVFPDRLDALEDALFGAMFRELRDISDPAVLRDCARSAGVPEPEVDAAIGEPLLRERAREQHLEGEELGLEGIPAVVVPGFAPITGAVPADVYRQAIRLAFSGPSTEPGHP